MSTLISPKAKLMASLALLGTLPLIAALQGMQASTVARALLAAGAFGGLGWWFVKTRGGLKPSFAMPKRLEVIQRVGLSQRTSMALIEVDGQPYLVIHGDGLVKLQRTSKRGPKLVSAGAKS